MLRDNIAASFLWLIISVVLIIGMAYWVTRYVAGRGGFGVLGPLAAGRLEILAQLTLGRDQRLVVARAGERCFLLGVAAGSITMLAEFTAEEAALWREQAGEKAAPAFREALNTILRQKGRG